MEESLFFAAFGGLAINGLSLLELKGVPKDKRPDFRDFFCWLPFLAWPLVGAVLAYAYTASGTALSPILAINIGASAPLIIRGMVSAAPSSIDPGEGA